MQQLTIPPLEEGEIYIGAIGSTSGDAYHLILLPGDNNPAPHQQQIEWAQSIGGDLPTKLESAMLFERAQKQFQRAWYWTNETFVDAYEPEESDAEYAWVQYFSYGTQSSFPKDYYYRARAVRRLPI